MYDTLICTTNTSPELVTIPSLASTKSSIDFSSLKRKSIVEVPKIKTENQQCMKRSSTNQYLERKRPPDPPPAPPNVVRPLSVSSMASLSSTSSSSGKAMFPSFKFNPSQDNCHRSFVTPSRC
ncbi:hypothetical protein WDU94_008250 [Cyamophila willieti]